MKLSAVIVKTRGADGLLRPRRDRGRPKTFRAVFGPRKSAGVYCFFFFDPVYTFIIFNKEKTNRNPLLYRVSVKSYVATRYIIVTNVRLLRGTTAGRLRKRYAALRQRGFRKQSARGSKNDRGTAENNNKKKIPPQRFDYRTGVSQGFGRISKKAFVTKPVRV